MKENKKTRLMIDLDGVCADFMSAVILHPDYKWNNKDIDKLDVFQTLDPIPGAIEAINKLLDSNKYEIYIASTAPWDNPKAWTDKRIWVEKYLPRLKKRLILTHHKELLCGSPEDIIIDDRLKNGVEKWDGVHLHFGTVGMETWVEVLNYLEK